MAQTRGFSIKLGPEFDPPYTEEWGWIDDEIAEDEKLILAVKDRKDFHAQIRRKERRVARRRAPRATARAALSTTVEISPGADSELLDLPEIRIEQTLDNLQDMAEASLAHVA